MRVDRERLRAQRGIFTVAEARVLGVPRQREGGYAGAVVYPGVRSVLGGPVSFEEELEAAIRYCGPGARVGGWTAARVLGYRGALTHDPPRIAIPRHRRVASRPNLIVTRSNHTQARWRLGFPLPVPAVLFAECATVVGPDQVQAMVASALQRREANLTEIASFCMAFPKVRGARTLRRVAAELASGSESVRELDCIRLFRRLGMPTPLQQVEIWDGDGLICVCDFYWEGVAGFFDGFHHLEFERHRRDRRNRMRLEAAGLQVVVIVGHPEDEADLIGRRLAAAFQAASQRPRPDRFALRPRVVR